MRTLLEPTTVRLGERLNANLREGFPEVWEFDPEWTWIAEREGEQIGFLLGAPCHGLAMMIMLKVIRNESFVVGLLLRSFFRDCLARGFKGYMVHLNHDSAIQYKFKRMAEKAGAKIMPYRIICLAGRLVDAKNW